MAPLFKQFIDRILIPYGITNDDIRGYIGIEGVPESIGMESDVFYKGVQTL